MKQPDANELIRLTQKLKTEDDISLEEADQVFSLLSKNMLKTKLNSRSAKADRDLMKALGAWFDVMAEKIEQGKRGNFIFTMALIESLPRNMTRPGSFIYEVQKKARTNLETHGRFEDLFTELFINRKAYSSLPKELQKLFEEETKDPQCESYYVLHSPRAGMYRYPIKTGTGTYTIAQFMERFAPVMKTDNYYVGNAFWGTAFDAFSDLLDTSTWSLRGVNKNVIYKCIIAAYMKYKEIPCITMFLRDGNRFQIIFEGEIVFFTEKDKAKAIKNAQKIPFEDIVKNALDEKAIDKRTFENLLHKEYVIRFPAEKFMEASVRYIDNVLRMQRELETAKRAVKNEEEWLEMTR